MSGGQEFDVAEYSSSEFVQRYANKQCPFVAIPVFPSRCFRHGFIGINKKSGITKPKDLEGKRIGVALYTMTAAIFIRGILQHEYGVDLRKVHLGAGRDQHRWRARQPDRAAAAQAGSDRAGPSNKSLERSDPGGRDRRDHRHQHAGIVPTNPDIVRLFPNFVELEKEFYKRTKIYPIMHLVAIKK